MENGLEEDKATDDGILTENNESNSTATIYCTCDCCNLFEPSGSSVKTRLVDQCSFNFSGLAQPNFCELDIVAKNGKVNTVIKLKSVPVVIEIPQGSKIFETTIENIDGNMSENSSAMLRKEVFKKCDSVSDGILETNANIRNKVEKYKNRKPKKSAEKHKHERTLENCDNINHCTSFIDNNEVVQKYDNLVNAKTMYFVNLPNKMDGIKKKKKKSYSGVEPEKDVVDDKRKIRKNTNEKESENWVTEKTKIDCNSKSIIINQIENDFAQLNNDNSQSSVCTTKERTASELSMICSTTSSKKSSSKRIHNNSPTSDVTIQEILVKPDKHKHKRKQKKRHQNSKQTSTDDDLKIKFEDVKERKKKPSSKRKSSSVGNVEKKSQRSGKVSSEPTKDKQALKNSNLNIQQKEIEEEFKVNINKRNRKPVDTKHLKKQSFLKQVTQQQQTSGNECLQNILKEEKNNHEQDNEIKVILKNKRKEQRKQEVEGKKHLKRRNHSLSTNRAKNIKLEATSIATRNVNEKTTSKERAINNKEANTTKKNGSDFMDGKENTQNLKPANLQPMVLSKDAEHNQPKDNSVLKLYFVERLAPSTSSLKLTDDLLLKLKAEQGKRNSLRSRSKQRPTTNDKIRKQERRSKSRVTKEEIAKSRTRHVSEGVVERRRSRKSASDVLKKRYVENFDFSASVEGKFESVKQKQVDLPSKTEKMRPLKVHKKKSKTSLNLSTTTFDNNWSKHLGKDSYRKEGISTITEKFLRKTVHKENRKWSKSCARKEYEFVCQYSEEENKTKSDTSVNRKNPEFKRPESLASKVRTRTALANRTLLTLVPEDKVYQQLCKLGAHQKNRIRVISKPIRSKDSSTTNKNNESSASVAKSHRLKPHPSLEKEKEAILNLFRQNKMSASSTKSMDENASGTKFEADGIRKKSRSQIRMRDKCSASTSEEETLKSLSEKTTRRKKRIKKRLFRREVSFTQLNVTPIRELYRKRSSISITKTSLSPEALFATKFNRVNLALGSAFRSCKTQETHSALFKKKVEDKASEKNVCERKLSYFHITMGEKILEISTKAVAKDGNTTVGFTVSGTEPPKRLRNDNVKKVTFKKSCKLQMTFLPPIEITENSGFGNEVPALNYCKETKKEDFICCDTVPLEVKVNKDDIIKVIKEMPLSFVPPTHLKSKKTSSLISYRRVSKLYSYRKDNFRSLWKKRIPKLARATKVEKIDSFKHHETSPIEVGKKEEAKKKEDNAKSCFNKLKLCRSRQTANKNKPGKTLSLLESQLQVIKEESHSTDSSRCRNCATEKTNVTTNIKNTQTDFDSSDDIIKMKEVLSYLCSAIEQTKNSNGKTEIKTAEKYLQTEKCLDSSTETSSYEERFAEARKNEKLNRFKKIIKLNTQKVNETSKSKSLKNTHSEEVKRCNKLSPAATGSSSYASSTINSKSLSTEKSSSGDVLSSGYFQKYKTTKALIDSKKKTKMESMSDKEVLTSIKSTFESTNTTAINVKVDKSIGTTQDEVVLVNQEQNTSEKQSNVIEDAVKNDNKILSSAVPTLKKFEDKSLQTIDHINAMVQVESNSQNNTTSNSLPVEKNASNSTNSDNNAIVEKFFKAQKEKEKKKTFQKPPSTFERLKRVFNTKEQKYIKNEVMAYNVSKKFDGDGKIVHGHQSPEMNYTNFIKFEKHLEEVLGLYPSIFKAIRAQMDFTIARNIDGESKEKKSDSFQSKSTLATTVDTVTEYKNTECYEKAPYSINNERCCNCYHVWHKKCIVQQYRNSQDFVLKSRRRSENIRQQKAYRRKIEEHRANKNDSTSSTKRKVPKRLKKNRTRQCRKPNFKETCGLHSITSVYSNDKGFLSSCSSISFDEKWSVASPLYGRSTISEDLSTAQQNIMTKEKNIPGSSQSLKVNKETFPSEGRKSKSLIEVSTKKSINRKFTLKQLINASLHDQNNFMQSIADEREAKILLMSLSSSCTVFTTPSKFLAKVEKSLKIEKPPLPPELASKAVGEGLVSEKVLPKSKPKVDEKLYRKILFPNAALHLKVNSIPKANRQKPFYIHQPSENNSELELDSLEVTSFQNKDEEEDFSTDSLEVIKNPQKSCNYNMLYTTMTYVKPANQTYLVYSNTVQYDKKLSKHTERDRHNSKHHKTTEVDRKRTMGFDNQNVSNTLTSESGYESTKSKRTVSIRNFFKKGGSLLDMFRSSNKTAAKTSKNVENQNVSNFTSFSSLAIKKEGTQNVSKKDAGTSWTKDKSSGLDKVYWHSINKDKKVGKHEKKATKAGQTDRESDTRSKCPEFKLFPASPSSLSYKKQKDECHAYAEKVLLESQLRREGYYKQYKDFKEIPLELLIGKKVPCRPKLKHQQTNSAQTSPISIQTEVNAEENKAPHSSAKYNTMYDLETDKNSAPRTCVTYVTEEKIVLQSDITKTTPPINPKELKEDIIRLNLDSGSKKDVNLKNLEKRKSLPLVKKILSRVMITKSKTDAEAFDKSKLCTNNDVDSTLTSPTKISDDLNSKASSESSKEFHEIYINSSGFRNNPVDIPELTQFTESESRIVEDTKAKALEESFGLLADMTRNEAKSTQFRSKSRSKTLEGIKLEKSKSDKLPISDRKHQNIAEFGEITLISGLHVSGNFNLKNSEQSNSGNSSQLYTSDSGHQKTTANILEATDFNIKSREGTQKNSRKDLEAGKIIEVPPIALEQQETTVTVAKVTQFSFKSRSNTPENAKSKSSSKTKHKSKSTSKSTSTKKSKHTLEEIKHDCLCKEETLDLTTEKQPKQESVDEESDTLQSIPNVSFKEYVAKIQLKQAVAEEPSTPNLIHVEEIPKAQEVLEPEELDILLQSEPIVSSIIDVIVSNSVTDDIKKEDDIQPQIEENKKPEAVVAELPQETPPNVSDEFRRGLSDKEVFEKLLESYEKKDSIAVRLSRDDDFFNSQIDSLKNESEESFVKQSKWNEKDSKVYVDERKSPHFWEEKMRQMRTKDDNPVKADDIGACFARGFRPDNITLSGNACFNLSKQDKLNFSEKMLSDEESIIDFSERETPLDYLLALGFMVDEASNALKDEDIRSRLLAAITEARVWVNKITTTQGTLLYLVAYKSRPKTMRYFLQLVEAIINRRINNAIKLDGFLRILEQVEEGEIQMINILGAEKFEDEESEERIVRKQLKQLFITVYKIAERESFQRGKPLSEESIFLLRILAAKYRAGLHPHLELIARYIGQELLTTEIQLEAAMIFLSRLDTAEVKLKEFEAYCDIRCEKGKKTERKLESAGNEKSKRKK